MKGLIKLLWFPYKCFCLYSLLVYILIFWTPFDGWFAGFMMMSYPAVLVIHLISIPVWLAIGGKKAVLPLLMSVLGGIFLPRTYVWRNPDEFLPDKSFKVMGYNAHSFMVNSNQKEKSVVHEIREMKKWVANSDADIICMPELYDDVTQRFNVIETLRNNGFRYCRVYGSSGQPSHHRYWGLALFSKYPIIHSRDTVFVQNNGLIEADIKIGNDTVRIIAAHLYSMTLNLTGLARQRETDGVVREGRLTLSKMKSGFVHRSTELKTILSWTKESPHPVIVCGDFNEVPYGYVYGEMSKILRNGFEEKGRGFGFSYNHLPYFIRIDHQFYDSKKLSLHSFNTLRDVGYSDHYPIVGVYSVEKKKD